MSVIDSPRPACCRNGDCHNQDPVIVTITGEWVRGTRDGKPLASQRDLPIMRAYYLPACFEGPVDPA